MAQRLSDMRTDILAIANSTRRGPPLGRLWPTVTVREPAQIPQILGVNSCTDQDLVVADSVLRGRLEMINDPVGSGSGGRLPYFCIYMADHATWLEPGAGCIREVAPYEIAVINSDRALQTVSTGGTRHLSVILPRASVLARLPWADEICGQGVGLDARSRSTAHALFATLRASIELDHFDFVGPCLVQALLALLSHIGTDTGPSRSAVTLTLRQEQVAECIRRHFAEPDLTVSTIAEQLRVSTRYLQRVCEGGASPGEQLRQFRLRKAAERLRSPSWRDRSISEICFSCGFSSSSHFSTEFRRFYGVTPKEYRA